MVFTISSFLVAEQDTHRPDFAKYLVMHQKWYTRTNKVVMHDGFYDDSVKDELNKQISKHENDGDVTVANSTDEDKAIALGCIIPRNYGWWTVGQQQEDPDKPCQVCHRPLSLHTTTPLCLLSKGMATASAYW